MFITKKSTNSYEIIHAIASKPFMKFGKFIEVRRRRDMSTAMWDKCFGCDHGFADDEDVYVGTVTKKGNIFFCKSCVEKYNTEKKIEGEI